MARLPINCPYMMTLPGRVWMICLSIRNTRLRPTFDLRPRNIKGCILRRHTIRGFPSFDPEKGILILFYLSAGTADLCGSFGHADSFIL